jgi:hypothetical protein
MHDNNQWIIDFLHNKDIALVGFAAKQWRR